MNKHLKVMFKGLFSGAIGAGIALLVYIGAIAFIKLLFLVTSTTMIVSRNKLLALMGLFLISGFFIGILCYDRKNRYYRIFKINGVAFWTDFIFSTLFTVLLYLAIRYNMNVTLSSTATLVLFVLLFILFYAFSAFVSHLYMNFSKRDRKIAAHYKLLAFIINPLCVLLYLWVFGLTLYNATFIPCAVSVAGIDANQYTADTRNLGLEVGERIISIDDTKVSTLAEVRKLINGLPSTKEVVVETDKSNYYLKTYVVDGRRYMGLVLKQEYCYNNLFE